MRLDVFLYESSLAKSRSYAAELVKKGLVEVNGQTVTKPSFNVSLDTKDEVRVTGEVFTYVGRGGVKLDAALKCFGVSPLDLICVDVGASTGGFTDCLLKNGALRVYAVDSGHGQLDPSLASDGRVVNMEGFNARSLSPDDIPEMCDLAVCDLSFISQTLVLPNICSVLRDGGSFITLIKPQFECGRQALGKGGIVKNKKDHEKACMKVSTAASECGLGLIDLIPSPIRGGDGNTEFLAFFKKGAGNLLTKKISEVTSGDKNRNTSF